MQKSVEIIKELSEKTLLRLLKGTGKPMDLIAEMMTVITDEKYEVKKRSGYSVIEDYENSLITIEVFGDISCRHTSALVWNIYQSEIEDISMITLSANHGICFVSLKELVPRLEIVSEELGLDPDTFQFYEDLWDTADEIIGKEVSRKEFIEEVVNRKDDFSTFLGKHFVEVQAGLEIENVAFGQFHFIAYKMYLVC